MQIITSEKKALLNLGKINGWIESSRNTTAIRESIAKLSFTLPQQDVDFDNIEDILSRDDNNQNLRQFIDVFMNHGTQTNDLTEDLRSIHLKLFSQKDGYRFHPGEWRDENAVNELQIAFDELSAADSSFKEVMHVLEKFHKIAPFRAGNELIERILPNIYLQRIGLIDKPFLTFHDMGNDSSDVDEWFKEKTAAVIDILHGVRDLQKQYEQRTVGLSKQRRRLFADLTGYMMKRPKFTIRELQADYEPVRKITFQTFSQLIKDLEKANILIEITGNERHRVFHLHEYTNLFKKIV